MTVGKVARSSRILFALLIVLAISGLAMGLKAMPASESAMPEVSDAEASSGPSVTCMPLGLYGDITTPVLVDRLSDTGDNLTFVGTTNGLYVVAPGGKLHHFLYSPFGIKHVALIDDITGDGIREVVVALNDTQVPALRCYDGASWEKLWQFAPMARIWDRLWVERQLLIRGLQVIRTGDSQSVVITFGRCVLSVDAADGTEQWRFSTSSALGKMATVADLTGDDTDELFVGSNDGQLSLLDGQTGQAKWQAKLPRHKGVNYNSIENLVGDIITMDKESGKVAVASADGWAQMYDLVEKRRVWETQVIESDSTEDYYGAYEWHISLAPDITDDGLPEVLWTKTPYQSQYQYGAYTNAKAGLCDSAGNVLWDKDSIVCSGIGLQADAFEGKPAFIEVDGQGVDLIDLDDGKSVLHALPFSTELGVIVRQPGGNGYLAFSVSGDLAAVSPKGELLWYYPRVNSVTAESGNFVGDSAGDVLFCGEWNSSSQYGYTQPTTKSEDGGIVYDSTYDGTSVEEPAVRLLSMMDGATRAISWSYEVSRSELEEIGGLRGVEVTPDLVGSDGIQDVIAYREDTVFIFSGKDGSLSTFQVGQQISSLEVIRNGASGNAIALCTSGSADPLSGGTDGLLIVDLAGAPLWTTTTADWIGSEDGTFMVLDDVNADNVSDLAVTSNARIVVLKSMAAATDYQLHLTFKAEADCTIGDTEIVPDVNQDGVRELAFIQQAEASEQGGQPNPLLSKSSLVDGKELFKVRLPASWFQSQDLACGDFDGDGYADSLFSSYSSGSGESEYPGTVLNLSILSGKDGATLRTHTIEANTFSGPSAGNIPLAINIGDVDGDGADDLAYGSTSSGKYEYYSGGYSYTPPEDLQVSLDVYSAVQDSILKSVPATPRLNWGEESPTLLGADTDGDGHLEVVSSVTEPEIPSYDPDAYSSYTGSSSRKYLAVVDIDSGRRLAGFMGFDTTTISLFETHQPGILGVAACGGACFLRTDADLQITSPENEARTGPTVGVAWEGPSEGDFSQVFVDGVRNDITNSLGGDLYLGRGNHDIVVRSVDECGRIAYGPADLGFPVAIKVAPSPWKPIWLVLSLFALLAVIVLLFYARLHRMWRARKRAVK